MQFGAAAQGVTRMRLFSFQGTDGPVWHDAVAPAGRTAWRAAHVHLIISAPGHRTVVAEIFDGEDPYLDTDAVFGVREALMGLYCTETDAAAAARLGLAGDQCLVMHTDLVLSPLA